MGESLPGGGKKSLHRGYRGSVSRVAWEPVPLFQQNFALTVSAFPFPSHHSPLFLKSGFQLPGMLASRSLVMVFGDLLSYLSYSKQRLPWKPFIPSQTCSLFFLPRLSNSPSPTSLPQRGRVDQKVQIKAKYPTGLPLRHTCLPTSGILLIHPIGAAQMIISCQVQIMSLPCLKPAMASQCLKEQAQTLCYDIKNFPLFIV